MAFTVPCLSIYYYFLVHRLQNRSDFLAWFLTLDAHVVLYQGFELSLLLSKDSLAELYAWFLRLIEGG